mmetsp:Transcript_12313/g.26999  ORF Transcript_12313/g.26999 Transcript_12313/m.26999 type:complete len:138 (+) Transcript_12313:1649-2062(+)
MSKPANGTSSKSRPQNQSQNRRNRVVLLLIPADQSRSSSSSTTSHGSIPIQLLLSTLPANCSEAPQGYSGPYHREEEHDAVNLATSALEPCFRMCNGLEAEVGLYMRFRRFSSGVESAGSCRCSYAMPEVRCYSLSD